MALGWGKKESRCEWEQRHSPHYKSFILQQRRRQTEEAIDDPCWVWACSNRDDRVLVDSSLDLCFCTFQYLCLLEECRALPVATMSQRILDWRTVFRDRHRGQNDWPQYELNKNYFGRWILCSKTGSKSVQQRVPRSLSGLTMTETGPGVMWLFWAG